MQPQYFSLNALYDSVMVLSEGGMNRLSRFYMTGLIRTYLIYMFVFIASITTATLFMKDAFKFDMDSFTPMNVYGILTALILVVAVCHGFICQNEIGCDYCTWCCWLFRCIVLCHFQSTGSCT